MVASLLRSSPVPAHFRLARFAAALLPPPPPLLLRPAYPLPRHPHPCPGLPQEDVGRTIRWHGRLHGHDGCRRPADALAGAPRLGHRLWPHPLSNGAGGRFDCLPSETVSRGQGHRHHHARARGAAR
eukprot:scaffold25689_cov118-Isochrysis_galbana.AAC.3